MSDTPDTAVTASDDIATGPAHAKPAAAARPSRAPWFILLLLLLLVAGAGYYWVSVMYRAEQAALEAAFATHSTALEGLGRRFDENAAELAAITDGQGTLESRLVDVVRTHDSLTDSVKALYARDAQVSLDWILAEAE